LIDLSILPYAPGEDSRRAAFVADTLRIRRGGRGKRVAPAPAGNNCERMARFSNGLFRA
jgi:hypothetical protein